MAHQLHAGERFNIKTLPYINVEKCRNSYDNRIIIIEIVVSGKMAVIARDRYNHRHS